MLVIGSGGTATAQVLLPYYLCRSSFQGISKGILLSVLGENSR